LKDYEESKPKKFEAEDDIDDLLDEFSSEVKIERRFSDNSFKSIPPEDVKPRTLEKEPVADDAKENYSKRNSYSIPRKDVRSKSFESEVRREEAKEEYAVQQAPYRKDTTTESLKSRPVLEELKQGYEVEQAVKSPYKKDTRTESLGARPGFVELKADRTVEQAPTELHRKDGRRESFYRRSPVIEDVKTVDEPAVKVPYRKGETAGSPRGRPVVENVKGDTSPQHAQKSPFQKEVRAESPRRHSGLEDVKRDHAAEQPRESNPRKEAESRSPVFEETQRAEPTLKAPYRKDVTPERAALEVKGGYTSKQAYSAPPSQPPRSSPAFEKMKEKDTPFQPAKTPHRDDSKIASLSDRKPPVSEAAKKVYAFEQDISEPPIEGVKVTDNWRGRPIQKPTPDEVKEEVPVGTNEVEDNDLFIPPATFKVRKSKKRFATRF
jgi:hypothetical protein